jgi:thiamine kinase-like enzyme
MELASNQETIDLHYRTLNHMLNNDDNPFRQIKKYIGLISALFKPSISANEKFKQKI